MIHILIITHSNFTSLYYEVLETLDLPIKIKVLELDHGEVIEKVDINYVSMFDLVIISGGHFDTIKRELSELLHIIPIYPIHFSESDLLKALFKAQVYSKKIMLMYTSQNEYNLDKYRDILKLDIKRITFDSFEEASQKLEKHHKEGYGVLIGSSSLCALAEEKKIKNFLIYSKDSLRIELIKAYHVAANKNEMLKYANFKESIYNEIIQPVFLSDQNGLITDVNKSGVIYLEKRSKEEIIGTSLQGLLNIPIDSIHYDGNKTKSIIDGGKKTKPIYTNNRLTGYITIINNFDFSYSNAEKSIEKSHHSRYTFKNIIVESAKMKKVIMKAKQYSKSSAPILILGESGTGKELIAHSIHKESDRKDQAFLPVNCSAIPQNILESELFGYEEGAFTGARKGGKPGYFEMAQNGTIFLDEIGEIPLEIQTKLLRVLQEKEIIRLGGKKIIPLDVRIISATNRSLIDLVKQGTFREDLYYRINVLQIKVPPLRERTQDILPIFNHLLSKYGLTNDQRSFLHRLGKDYLTKYDWHGNIRELENFVMRLTALITVTTTTYDLLAIFKDVITEQFSTDNEEINFSFEDIPIETNSFKENQRITIIKTLMEMNGNKVKAAEKLGISRSTLWRKMKELKIK